MKAGLLTIALACLSTALRAADSPAELSNDTTVRIIFPHATINGQPARLALDTGTPDASTFDNFVSKHNIKLDVPIDQSTYLMLGCPFALTETTHFTIGSQSYSAPLLVMQWSQWGEFGCDALVGWNNIKNNILVFNPAQHTVIVTDKLPPDLSGWLKLKIRAAPILELELPLANGLTGTLMVDTGSPNGLCLSTSFWAAYQHLHPNADIHPFSYIKLTGPTYTKEALASAVTLGPLTLTQVSVYEASTYEMANSSSYVGTLGMAALARLDLILDGPGGYAYLRPKPAEATAKAGSANWAVIGNPVIKSGYLYAYPALAKLKSGNNADALVEVGQGLMLESDNAALYAVRGEIERRQHNYDDAIVDLNHALELDSGIPFAHLSLGMVKSDRHDYEGALAEYDRTIALNPHAADAYGARGGIKLAQHDYVGATADLQNALQLDPNNLTAGLSLGDTKIDAQDFDGAIADFNRLLAHYPQEAWAYAKRGTAKACKKDFPGALADLNHAIDLDSQDPGLYLQRGSVKVAANDLDGAMIDFDCSLALEPKNLEAYLERAAMEMRLQDTAGAIADYTEVLRLDPQNIHAYSLRAGNYYNRGDFRAAIADFSRSIELRPKEAGTWLWRGRAEGELGDYAAAIADYSQTLALDSKQTEAYYGRAYAEQNAGNFSAALKDLAQYITLKPDNAEYPRINQHLLLLRLGQPDKDFAQTVAGWKDGWSKSIGQYLAGSFDDAGLLKSALTKDQEPVKDQQCEAYYYIGIIHLLHGDQTGAREFFQKCLATNQSENFEYAFSQSELARLDAAEKSSA